jgi:hypothetical protein
MLQVDALLVAWAPWSGLLQDHADDARASRTASIDSGRPLFTSPARDGSNVLELSRARFFKWRDCGALPRTSALLLTSFYTSARLV